MKDPAGNRTDIAGTDNSLNGAEPTTHYKGKGPDSMPAGETTPNREPGQWREIK